MPQPGKSQLHVNRPLTNISIAFRNQRQDFVADRVFAPVPVSKQSDLFFIFDKDQWLRTDAQKRAPGSESAGSGFTLSTGQYSADVWALHKDVSDQERSNADAPIDLDRSATEFVTEQMLLRREKEFVSKAFSASIWTGSTTGGDITPGTLWDASGSDPIVDVREQARAMKRKTGKKPNKLVVGPEVHDALVDNAAIIDRIGGGSTNDNPAIVTRQLLAMIFEVDEYLVAEAVENTAAENATFVGADVFGKNALLVFSEPNPGLMKPSAGYTFTWTGLLGARAGAAQMSSFRIDRLKSDRIEGEMAFDQKVVASDLGVFFSGAVS